MDRFNKIYLVGIVIVCIIVLTVFINTVYGQDIITPINTHNKQQYCGFGERDDCINIIPQNQPISLSQIQNLDNKKGVN